MRSRSAPVVVLVCLVALYTGCAAPPAAPIATSSVPVATSPAAIAASPVAIATAAAPVATSATPVATSAAPVATLSAPAPAINSGRQSVAYHGLTVVVPSAWKLGDTRCGTPIHDTVILPGPSQACLITPAPKVTSVVFGQSPPQAPHFGKGAVTRQIMIGGDRKVAATRTSTTPGSVPFVIVVDAPELHVSVQITAQVQSVADALAATLAVTDVDGNGCKSIADDVAVLPTGTPSVRAGGGTNLLPGAPEAISVCRYAAGLLEQSAAVPRDEVAAFVHTMNAAPPGLSRTPTGTYLKDLCRTPGEPIGTVTSLDSSDAEAYRVQARYPAGPPVIVIARLSLCGNLGASNGSATGQRTDAMVDLLVQSAGAAQGWSGSVVTAPQR